MNHAKFIGAALLGLAAATVTPADASAPTPASAPELRPGASIGAENAAEFARYLPEAARFALAHGLRMNVLPARRIEWSEGFRHATELYSGQVRLDEHDHLQNYVAGMPFPLIEVTDPKAAVKIAYNWHMGPFMPDDFLLAPWSSNAYEADPSNPMRIAPRPDYDYACEQFDFLRFAHRTEVEPRPTIGDNPTGAEWKARCNRWTAEMTGATGEGAGIWIRYLDPRRPDDFYAINPNARRVRRMAVNLSFPNEQCRGCHQPYWAYALPKTENYRYRLLGTTTLLACLSSATVPAGIRDTGNGFALTEEPFEPRHAYILEMTPRAPSHESLRTIIYIDSEIFVWLAAEFHEAGGLASSAIPLWHMKPSPRGGNVFELAGNFYVPARSGGFFRSLVPAHPSFRQEINTGAIPPSAFVPQFIAR